jgi:WD40 repeat protein/uncharacterized caspase-like protein
MRLKVIIFFTLLLAANFLYGQQVRLVSPEGHTEGVQLMDYSPDGNYLITATTDFQDRTAKVWELKSGKLIFSLKEHLLPITTVCFSKNGKYILTTAGVTNNVWNAETGDLMNGKDTLLAYQAIISHDSKYLIYPSYYTPEIIFWNIEAKTEEKRIHTGAEKYTLIKQSADGKYLIASSKGDDTGGNSTLVAVWEVVTGQKTLITNFSSDSKINIYPSSTGKFAIIAGEKNFILLDLDKKKITADTIARNNYSSFKNDGRQLKFSTDDKYFFLRVGSVIKKYQTDNLQLLIEKSFYIEQKLSNIASFDLLPDENKLISIDYDGYLSLVSIDSLQETGLYNIRLGRVNGLKVSPQSKQLTISTFNQYTWVFNLPDLSFATSLFGSSASIRKATPSADGKKICLNNIYGDILIADAETGKVIENFSADSLRYENPVFSPDGKKILAAINNKKALTCFNAENGSPLFRINAEAFLFYNYLFNPNGKTFVTWEAVETKLAIWDATTGKELYKYHYTKKGGKGNAITYTDDGKWMLINNYNSIEIRDGYTGKLVRTLKGAAHEDDEIEKITLSPDGQWVAAVSKKYFFYWNFISGELKAQNSWGANSGEDEENDFLNASFSPDSKKIIITLNNGQAIIINTATAQKEFSLNNHNPYTILNAVFSPDGKKTITIGSKLGYIVFNPIDNRDASYLAGEKNEEISDYLFSKNGKEIITVSENSLRRYNIESGKLLYRTIFINKNDWLVTDTVNRYDGTEAARKLLYFTCGKEIIELEQVKDLLWVPNLAERINAGDSITSKKLSDIDICGLTPLVTLVETDSGFYHYSIIPRRGGLGVITLQINGIDVKYYKKEALKPEQNGFQLIIPKDLVNSFFVTGQQNKVSLKALTADNNISSRNVIIDEDLSKTSGTPPNLYAVVVGVSDYKGTELDLKYAAKDAADFAATIGNTAKKLLNTDSVNHVYVYNINTDQKGKLFAEKNNILNALTEISKKATASDILLIFFAGHGVMEGEKKQFYFLTADASKTTATDNISQVSISTTELTEWIKPENIKAQKRVLIFDACNSGQAINDLIKIGSEEQGYAAARNDEKTQQIKVIDKLNEKTGLFILSASASNQSAYEMSKYSQGLLTYSLLKAIKEQPAILYNNRFLDLGKWFNTAKESVEELSRETGARQEPQLVSNTNFIIGVVDEEVLSKIILPEAKPVFDASNFQNVNPLIADDDWELSKLLNRQLSEISSRNVNSTIIYAHATSAIDAFTLTGRYTITGSQIIVKVNIKQRKKIVQKFEVAGNKDDLEKTGIEIIARASQLISQLKK